MSINKGGPDKLHVTLSLKERDPGVTVVSVQSTVVGMFGGGMK